MSYLYHRIPKNMVGDTLYPLNQLKDMYPEVYVDEVSKYKGREELLKRRIPLLDCLWNDVLHLSAVHPQEVQKYLVKYGSELKSKKFFAIDPYTLERERVVVYPYTMGKGDQEMEDFIEFVPEEIGNYADFPEETERYYKAALGKGDNPLVWHGIPHFLYCGTLDVKQLPVIEIS